MLKSLFRVKKSLNILLAIAFTIVIAMDVALRDIPELFPKGAAIGEAIYRLSLSFIASYIFYFVVVHLKAEKDRKNISAYLLRSTTGILANASNLMRDILKNSGTITMEHEVTNEVLFDALRKIGPNQRTVERTYDIGISNPTWTQYLTYFERRCLANISEAFEKMSLLDTELVALLSELRHSGLFRHLEIARNPGVKNANFETVYPDFHAYFSNCMRLRDYVVLRVLPYVEVKNPEFYKSLVQFNLGSDETVAKPNGASKP